MPASPIKKTGWIPTGCDRGSVMSLGARNDVKVPTKKLLLNSATGTVGKEAMISADAAPNVSLRPPARRKREIIIVTSGPLSARSSRLFRFSGKDLKGVIQFQVPN